MIGLTLAAVVLAAAVLQAQEQPRRITVLYDAFGAPSDLERDWGFAALVEYGGKRILFDTGNDASIFERNVKRLGVDLTKLDAVFISHRHGDHTTGLNYLLEVNAGVRIFAPQEGAFFKSRAPKEFLAPYPDLPPHLRYYGGRADSRGGREDRLRPLYRDRRLPPRAHTGNRGSPSRRPASGPLSDRTGRARALHERARLRRVPGELQGAIRCRRGRCFDSSSF